MYRLFLTIRYPIVFSLDVPGYNICVDVYSYADWLWPFKKAVVTAAGQTVSFLQEYDHQHNAVFTVCSIIFIIKASYLSHPEDRLFFPRSLKYRSGSRVGDSGSFLDMISYHDFCLDRNRKFPKIPPDRSFGRIRRFLELRIAFWIKFSG